MDAAQRHVETRDAAATAYSQGTPLRSEIEPRDAGLIQSLRTARTEAIASRHGQDSVAGGRM